MDRDPPRALSFDCEAGLNPSDAISGVVLKNFSNLVGEFTEILLAPESISCGDDSDGALIQKN